MDSGYGGYQGGTVTIATQQGQAKTKGQQRKASEADPGTHIATAPTLNSKQAR